MLRNIVAWITFHCNFTCPYCVIRLLSNEIPETKQPEEWVKVINKFNSPLIIDITGGEPFCYKGLRELVSGIEVRHSLAITTNFSFTNPTDAFLNRFSNITLSFHPTMLTQELEEDFLDRAKVLRANYNGDLKINYVAYQPQIYRIPQLKSEFEKLGIRFHVDPQFDTEYTEEEQELISRYIGPDRFIKRGENNILIEPRLCSAGQTYIQVLPNGVIIPCSRKPTLGNFFDETVSLNKDLTYCNSRECSGCDWDACWIYDLDRKPIKRGK